MTRSQVRVLACAPIEMKKIIALTLLFFVILAALVTAYILSDKDVDIQNQDSKQALEDNIKDEIRLELENLTEVGPDRAGDYLDIKVKVFVSGTDKIVTDKDGVAVAISAYRTEVVGDAVSPVDAQGLSGYAKYDNGVWLFKSSKFPQGSYRYDITAYCQDTKLACGSWMDNPSYLQIARSYYFNTYPPAESQVVSIFKGEVLNQTLPLSKSDQIFAVFSTSNLIEYALIAHRAGFNLIFETTPQELLRNVTIVDDKGDVVAGPVDAIEAGYENQLQKVIFSDFKIKSGNHVYYIKGDTPDKKAGFSIHTTPKDDWIVEFENVPGTYADLETSASIFFDKVQVGM